jgi:hypothetical protein
MMLATLSRPNAMQIETLLEELAVVNGQRDAYIAISDNNETAIIGFGYMNNISQTNSTLAFRKLTRTVASRNASAAPAQSLSPTLCNLLSQYHTMIQDQCLLAPVLVR